MRRTVTSRIAQWDFGHPHMGAGFGQVWNTKGDSSHIIETPVERTVLANGVTVITHDKGCVAATVGMFADAGAKYDALTTAGLAVVQRQALFGGNMHNSMFQIDRAFRAIGAAYGHTDVNKRWIGAWAAANRAHFRTLLDEIAPAFASPRFAEPDIERLRDNFDAQREELRWNNPRIYAVDELERLAFYKEPLGAPRTVPPESNDMCSSSALLEKYAATMSPDRCVLVGINVSHQELIAAYEGQALTHSKDAPHFQKAKKNLLLTGAADEKAQYYAGKTKLEFEDRSGNMKTKPDQEPEGIAALGWLSVGADATVTEYAAGLVYRELIAASIGEALANPAGQRTAHGIHSFYRPFSTAGLVGVTVRGAPAALPAMLEEAAKALPNDMASNLSAGKARAATTFYSAHCDNMQDYAAFIATSKWSAEEVVAAIESVSANAVAQVGEIARAAAPCLYATGDVLRLPTAKKLQL